MIFVDTGGWYATVIASEVDHAAAARWLRGNRERLLTTDYVVDEALTLMRSHGQHGAALVFGTRIFSGQMADVYYVTEDDIAAAWQVFQQYDDKGWSFTDCTSKVVMEKLALTHAFAFDQHFRQFGTVVVVP